MAGLTKTIDDEGTYSVLCSGQVVRLGLTAEDADEVMAGLRSMEPDQD